MLRERLGLKKGTKVSDNREMLKNSLTALLKTPEDLEAGIRHLEL